MIFARFPSGRLERALKSYWIRKNEKNRKSENFMKIMKKIKKIIFCQIASRSFPDILNMFLEFKNMIYDIFQLFSDGNVSPEGLWAEPKI